MKALFFAICLLLLPALAHADSAVSALSPVTNPIPSGSCMYVTPGAGLDAKDCITSPGTAFNYNTIKPWGNTPKCSATVVAGAAWAEVAAQSTSAVTFNFYNASGAFNIANGQFTYACRD